MPSTVTSVGAPVTATQCSRPAVTARPPSRHSTPTASSGLPTRRLASRRAARSAAPEPETPRWARPGRPRSCSSACGPVRSTISTTQPTRTNRTLVPGLSRAGGCRSRSHRRLLVLPDQLPAAGSSARVDPRPDVGQPDRPGRHGGPRAGPGGAPAGRRPRPAGSRSRGRSRRSRPSSAARCGPRSPGRRSGRPARPPRPGPRRRSGPRSPPVGRVSAVRRHRRERPAARAVAVADSAASRSQEDRPRPGHQLGHLGQVEDVQGSQHPGGLGQVGALQQQPALPVRQQSPSSSAARRRTAPATIPASSSAARTVVTHRDGVGRVAVQAQRVGDSARAAPQPARRPGRHR